MSDINVKGIDKDVLLRAGYVVKCKGYNMNSYIREIVCGLEKEYWKLKEKQEFDNMKGE